MYKIKYSKKALDGIKVLQRSGKWNKIKPTIDKVESILKERGVLPDGTVFKNHKLNKDNWYGEGTFDCHLAHNIVYIYKPIDDVVNVLCIGSHNYCRIDGSAKEEETQFTIKAASRLAVQ